MNTTPATKKPPRFAKTARRAAELAAAGYEVTWVGFYLGWSVR